MLNPAGRCRKASLVRWRHRRGSRKQLQAKTGGSRRLLHGRWVGRMAAGWRQDGRTNWTDGVVRVGRGDHRALGPAKRRCLGGLPPLFVLFSTGRRWGIRHHHHAPPPLKAQVLVQCPRCSPPTLQRSAKMEPQGREGTVGQHGRGGPTRGGPFSTQAPLPVLHSQWPLATAHRGPAAQQQEGSSRRAAARAGGHSRGFGSDQPEFAAHECFFAQDQPNVDIEDAPPTTFQGTLEPRDFTSSRSSTQLAVGQSVNAASTSAYETTRDSGTDQSRNPTPSHGVSPEPSRTPVNSGPRTKNGRPGPAKGTWASSAASPTSFFSTPTSPAAGNLANKTEKMTAMTES